MRDLTIVITGSEAHKAIAGLMGIDTDVIDVTSVNARNGYGTDIGPNHRVYSQVFPELEPVDVTPARDEEAGDFTGPVAFDPVEQKPQQLTHSACKQLRIEQPSVFFQPEKEGSKPRYQTKNIDPRHFMEMFEFLRKDENGDGEDVLANIMLLARKMEDQGDTRLRTWVMKEGAGPINIDHIEVVTGLAMLVAAGEITQDESDQLSKGWLIK